jgi:predicted MFS family arabinose efflux permease
MFVCSVGLAILTWLGMITPALLLAFTFLIGCGAALNAPAWQASVGEQVPREDVPRAIALNSMGFNLARSLGPAIGGLVVAAAGASAAFLLNACSYVGLIAVLATWRKPPPVRTLPAERLGPAMVAGVQFARLSPTISGVLVRAFAFGSMGSAIWALMPLVARVTLKGGPATYGVLLGGLGIGAVVGAFVSTRLRERFSSELVVRFAGLAFGAAIAVTAFSTLLPLSLAALLLAGAGWVLTLSSFNVTVQVNSPGWVVGRTMALLQSGVFGGLASGSWAWGHVAEVLGLPWAIGLSAAATAATVLLGLRWPLPVLERPNLAPARAGGAQQPTAVAEASHGAVIVTVEYQVSEADADAFIAAMVEKRRIRTRDGARRWTLMQDLTQPELWLERFHSPSWVEHLRQRYRTTVADQAIEERVRSFHKGDAPPRIRRLIQRLPGSWHPGEPPTHVTLP